MTTIQERLAAFLAELNIPAQSFERECKLGMSTASRLSEKSRHTTFAKISKAYPQLNMEWLKTGQGDMLRPVPAIDIDIKKSKVRGDQVLVGDMIKIGNPEALHKEEETVCSLRREINHLNALLKEKDARIGNLEDTVSDQKELIAEYRSTIHDLKQSK